jgi:hypothetical protein
MRGPQHPHPRNGAISWIRLDLSQIKIYRLHLSNRYAYLHDLIIQIANVVDVCVGDAVGIGVISCVTIPPNIDGESFLVVVISQVNCSWREIPSMVGMMSLVLCD